MANTLERPPNDVLTRAHQESLGRHIATFHPKRRTVAVIAMIVMGLASLVILVGFYFLWLAFQSSLNPRQAAKRVYVFDHGFMTVNHAGPESTYRWDRISSVYQEITVNYSNGIKTGTTYVYTIIRDDDVQTKLTHFYDDIARLGRLVCDQVARTHLPAVEAKLSRGENVQFGDVSIGRPGIAIRKGIVPWPEVEAVNVREGYVSIKRAGKWMAAGGTPAKKIPNLYLFLHLADRFLGVRG